MAGMNDELHPYQLYWLLKKLGKPRLIKSGKEWVCLGSGSMHCGIMPRDAYKAWLGLEFKRHFWVDRA